MPTLLDSVAAALAPCCQPGQLTFDRTLSSSVTTAWGVAWNEAEIARDLMQNFFDANRDRLAEVVVQRYQTSIAVTAPAACSLERLFYLGSEKGADDVGQYGEGFKAAAVCLLRDHQLSPIVASGVQVVSLRIAPSAVGESRSMFPVEYDFYRAAHPIAGTVLVLPGASPQLVREMEAGLSHFFYPANKLLGAQRWRHYRGDFELYDSTDHDGHVFYRQLRRGRIEGFPVILVINKPYQAIERKTSQDRDRKAFGAELMETFYDLYSKYGVAAEHYAARLAVERVLLEAGRRFWEQGHPLLSRVAKANRHQDWDQSASTAVFQMGYYAHSSGRVEEGDRLAHEQYEQKWKQQGRIALPGYFTHFGLPSAATELKALRARAAQDAKDQGSRTPSPAEREALDILREVLRALNPAIIAHFSGARRVQYTVAATEALQGELRAGRDYRSREVFLAAELFASEFSYALAVFLHEHAHIFGYDGSRAFTDALTELLETVIKRRSELDAWETRWDQARAAVQAERAAAAPAAADDSVAERIARLDEPHLRELLARLPQSQLKGLLKAHDTP